MTEIVIFLEDIDPVVFCGANNSLIDKIRGFFPKIKIIARGSEIKCMGEEGEITVFAEKFNEIIEYYRKYHRLDEQDIEKYFFDAGHMKSASNGEFEQVIVFGTSGKPVRARTVNQLLLVSVYKTNDLIIAEGPAGTGKTYTSIALAVRALKEREVRKIVLTRPAVEAGENLGFLPGDLKEKLDPYLQPLYDALFDMIPADKFVITGDVTQIDLAKHQPSGLLQAMKILPGNEGIDFVYLDKQDVIRHKIVKRIIEIYDTNKQNIESAD